MTRTALAALIALALGAQPALAETKPAPRPPPSSYAPTPHSGPHVYGSPIGPPIVGPARTTHRNRATTRSPVPHGKHAADPKHAPAPHPPS